MPLIEEEGSKLASSHTRPACTWRSRRKAEDQRAQVVDFEPLAQRHCRKNTLPLATAVTSPRLGRDCDKASLAVMNMGNGFTTGPAEAAYVINELVKPASVIASHANEVGTANGKGRPGARRRPS